MNKPGKPAERTADAKPPPSLMELIGTSEGGLSFPALQSATGLRDAALQTALDALEVQGKIAIGVNNDMLCYRCV